MPVCVRMELSKPWFGLGAEVVSGIGDHDGEDRGLIGLGGALGVDGVSMAPRSTVAE